MRTLGGWRDVAAESAVAVPQDVEAPQDVAAGQGGVDGMGTNRGEAVPQPHHITIIRYHQYITFSLII